jgi:hypothetical protein
VSVSVQLAAFALADFLMGAAPGDASYRAVAFLLSLGGHQRAGAPGAAELHRRIRLKAESINKNLRKKMGLDYDPLDIIEFDSFDSLLKKKPPGGTPWNDILLVTHGGGDVPREFSGEIFFGREIFVVSSAGTNDLLDAMNKRRKAVEAFRKGFAPPSNITLIACGGGAAGPDVAVYVRELFGTDGLIKTPKKDVDFTSKGEMGTPKDPERPTGPLRPLTKDEWLVVPPKEDILNAVDPMPPDDFFFRD